MPRRKPTSTTQKKAEQKLKRAVKRGDVSPPPPAAQTRRKRPGHPSRPPPQGGQARPGGAEGRGGDGIGDEVGTGNGTAAAAAAAAAAKKLESKFLKPSASYLALSTELASTQPLVRPIPASACLLPRELRFDNPDPVTADVRHGHGQGQRRELTCPKRPKWRYGMSKKEVERNEEGWFARWREETDGRLGAWREREKEEKGSAGSPSYYEYNLEVWRQLWRVTELSEILLILLDARCPPLHYPPSLQTYLRTQRTPRRVILVLTKVDVVGHERAAQWAAWLTERYKGDGVRVVMVESYRDKGQVLDERGDGEGRGKKKVGSRRRVEPFLPPTFRSQLVKALREAHAELIAPPKHISEDAEKLARWKCKVRRDVDWEALEKGIGSGVVPPHKPAEHAAHVPPEGVHEQADRPSPGESEDGDGEEDGASNAHDAPPEYLTVGLIGQPNVGKSSLLNALFGRPRVRASRTPGKTKHFQTLFLSRDVRLVDCPGLVVPSYVHMEQQALCGVLPISQLPSMPSCISYALGLVPLERILGLGVPDSVRERLGMEAKKTWRGERKAAVEEAEAGVQKWTAMQVLEAYAEKRGWITAKAGRPDVNRAGNAIMRALAEAKIPWGFAPPDADVSANVGQGIWLGKEGEDDIEDEQDEATQEEEEDSATDEEERTEEGESAEGSGSESEEEVREAMRDVRVGGGLFAALAGGEGSDEEEEEEEEAGDDEDEDGSDEE